MTQQRFWVIGGDYECTAFKSMKGGVEALGPFTTREEAANEWRRLATETRSRATARYSIAVENLVLPT